MHALPIRRLSVVMLGVVILFTIVAWLGGNLALIRGLWLALLWQAASVMCLVACGRLLRQPATPRRTWQLAGMACLKFPALYTLGYLALRWLAPSAVGLAIGLTIPWIVLLVYAMAQLVTSLTTTATARNP